MDLLDLPIVERPMTAAHVLAILRDFSAYELGDQPENLTFATTIHEWLAAMDLSQWRLGEYLGRFFNIQLPAEVWRDTLFPPKQRTIGDLCQLVAQHAWIPAIEPVSREVERRVGLRGGDEDTICLSWAAGAFLLVRRLMAEKGIATETITPTTELFPILDRQDDLLVEFCKIAPGRLPIAFEQRPLPTRVYSWSRWLVRGSFLKIFICTLLAAAGIAGESGLLAAFTFVLLFVGLLGLCIAPKKTQLGDLRTFGDLAWAMVATSEAAPVSVPTDFEFSEQASHLAATA